MRQGMMWWLALTLSLSACGSSKTSEEQQPGSKVAPSGSVGGMMGDGGMMGGHIMGDGSMHGSQMGSGQHPGSMGDMCPMKIKGTTAHAEDVERGAALLFTTTGDVTEVRGRVGKMAAMHTSMHARGMGGMAGDGGMAMKKGEMMASSVKVDEIEGGARVVFTARDVSKVDALRAEVRDHAAHMATGDCPMMGGNATP